jgi:integrase
MPGRRATYITIHNPRVLLCVIGRVGVDTIHPHAFRHAWRRRLLKRSGGNFRAVQEHLRHADIQATTIYTRLAPQDLRKVVNLFDENNGGRAR